MRRSVSYALIVAGLILAGIGIESIWTARDEEKRAEQLWESDTVAQSVISGSSRRINKGDLLARLSIKRLKSKWVVVEGADDAQLRRGPGHLMETATPGSFGNCVIAGHRDTHFAVLKDIKIGEKIALEREGKRYVYRVTRRAVVEPDNTDLLKATIDPTLTLVTCYPFSYVGPAPKRFIVQAQLISSSRLRA